MKLSFIEENNYTSVNILQLLEWKIGNTQLAFRPEERELEWDDIQPSHYIWQIPIELDKEIYIILLHWLWEGIRLSI